MLLKWRKCSVTISAELHEKIARSCEPVDQTPSEVVCVRSPRTKFSAEKPMKPHYVHVLAHPA